MQKVSKKALAILATLLFIYVASYYLFSAYQPKVLKQLQEVRGAQSENFSKYPYPQNSKEIGLTKTQNGILATIQTTKTPPEVQTFYKTILTAKNWKIKAYDTSDIFNTVAYKKGDNEITITAYKQQGSNYTIAGIELKKIND